MKTTVLLAVSACCAASVLPAQDADDWQPPRVTLPQPLQHPAIACTHEELSRLQTAYRGSGPEHRVVADVVQLAAKNLGRPLTFPPRGGQHNQWYQ